MTQGIKGTSNGLTSTGIRVEPAFWHAFREVLRVVHPDKDRSELIREFMETWLELHGLDEDKVLDLWEKHQAGI